MENRDKKIVLSQENGSDRRQVVKQMLAGAGAVAAASMLPDSWVKPVVGNFALPAHAETSGKFSLVKEDVEEATDQVNGSGEYNTVEVYSLVPAPGNNKKFSWLNKTGAAYGGQVKFVFEGCGELIVPNAAVSHGADGNARNYNQSVYFCGTDFAPGTKEYNRGLASVFAPPGCTASTVTMHYNK